MRKKRQTVLTEEMQMTYADNFHLFLPKKKKSVNLSVILRKLQSNQTEG